MGATGPTTVTVVGTGISATVDPSGSFTLTGVPPGTVQLQVTGPGVSSIIVVENVAQQQRVEIVVTIQNGAATLDGDERTSFDPEIELSGPISGLSGSCPTLSFTVNGTAISTDTTNAVTDFDDGGCAALGNGTPVRVDGLRLVDGSVRATQIEVDEVTLLGTVAGLSGSCPSLTFSVGGTTVITDVATTFEDGTCTVIENGMSVEIEGQRQTDGTVRATEVDIGEVKIEGSISGLSWTCPDLAVAVDGRMVTTDVATRFDDAPCSDVRNGFEAEVRGLLQPDESLRATRVKLEIEEVELEGVVAGLTGSCQSIGFLVSGTAVATDAGTRFDEGVCVDVQNGTQVEVKGILQPDGSVKATGVKLELDDDVELDGVVASLTGSCPNLRFSVTGTTVTSDASTEFDDGACSDVQDGTQVEVKGSRQPDGTVRATEVKLED